MNKLKPVTPGEILLEEFLKPMGLSQYRLAKEVGVPAQRISDIVAGRRSIRQILISVCAGFSVCPTDIGYALRLHMTLRLQSVSWGQSWQRLDLGQPFRPNEMIEQMPNPEVVLEFVPL